MKPILILLFICPWACVAATNGHTAVSFQLMADSSAPRLESKASFMKEFGTSDTSRALIRYYFYRGKNDRRFIWLPFVFAAPFVVGGIIILSREPYKRASIDADDSGIALPVALLLIAGSLGVAIAWSITSAVRYRLFRKKLRGTLLKYQKTGELDKRISRSTLFRVALKGEPAMFPWNQPKPAPRAPRSRSKMNGVDQPAGDSTRIISDPSSPPILLVSNSIDISSLESNVTKPFSAPATLTWIRFLSGKYFQVPAILLFGSELL